MSKPKKGSHGVAGRTTEELVAIAAERAHPRFMPHKTIGYMAIDTDAESGRPPIRFASKEMRDRWLATQHPKTHGHLLFDTSAWKSKPGAGVKQGARGNKN